MKTVTLPSGEAVPALGQGTWQSLVSIARLTSLWKSLRALEPVALVRRDGGFAVRIRRRVLKPKEH